MFVSYAADGSHHWRKRASTGWARMRSMPTGLSSIMEEFKDSMEMGVDGHG